MKITTIALGILLTTSTVFASDFFCVGADTATLSTVGSDQVKIKEVGAYEFYLSENKETLAIHKVNLTDSNDSYSVSAIGAQGITFQDNMLNISIGCVKTLPQ